jgi:uncharacterized membrane protein YraQ (UPF0718 family)
MTSTLWLILALLALLSGPLFHGLARSRGLALAGLDGFSCTAVAGLVVAHGLPEAFARAGWLSLLAALVGLVVPTLFERMRRHLAPRAHAAALGLALLGLALHAFADGSAIGSGNDSLSLAVVLHRLPVSLAVWMLLLGHLGPVARGLALLGLGAATAGGYFTGVALLGDTLMFGLLEGLVSGSLLHVVFHRSAPASAVAPARRKLARATAAVGALAGAGLVSGAHLLDRSHGYGLGLGEGASIGNIFLSLALESAPALLLAYLGAGLLDAFMPHGTVSWMRRGSNLTSALRGVAFGLPLPVCSCGVIPLYRSLVVRGTPAAAALAFLVATPEIGIDAVLLSLPLLGTNLTLVRLASAAVVAVAVGWFIGRLAPAAATEGGNAGDTDGPTGTFGQRLAHAARAGLGEVVDSTGPWILLGLAIAAVGARVFDPVWLGQLPTGAGVLVFALAGIPTYVCASGATPLVTMLVSQGVSPGAALAFLLTGPATNATTFGVLSQLHGPRIAGAFGLTVALLAIGLGFAVNALLPHPDVFPLTQAHEMAHVSTFRWICLGLLAAVYLISLLRQGPRAFLGRVYNLSEQPADACSTEHDHGHGESSCCGS